MRVVKPVFKVHLPGEIIAITLPSATLTCSIARNLSVSAFFCNTSSSSLCNKGILRSLGTRGSLLREVRP